MSDIYLKIAGLDGDVSDEKYPKHIQVLSLDLGGGNPSSVNVGVQVGSSGGGGKVIMKDVRFTKVLDRSSPSLITKFFAGEHFKEFEFKYVISRGDSSDVFKTVKLTDVLITSFKHSCRGAQAGEKLTGAAGKSKGIPTAGALPQEALSLNFGKIEFGYRPRKADGGFGEPVKSGYDVVLAKPL